MSKKLFLLTSFILVLALACTNVSFGATIERTIANGIDDVEERPSRGNAMDIDSSDLEFPYEDKNKGDPQVLGLRFLDIAIPKGATITNASVQFKVDETKDGTLAVNVIVDGELAANAALFTSAAFSVTSRVRTTASVQWSVPNWTKEGDRGPDQATPNIAAVIQEIVNQDGWVSGNALVLTISDDASNPSAGLRCAEAFEGDAPGAAMLHIDYEEAAPPPPPPPPPPAPISVDIRIANGLDDHEERVSSGKMDAGSSDLEFAYETGGTPAKDEQLIGLRFVSIAVAKGAQITGAYVEIEVDKVNKEGSQAPVNLIIEGELTPDAAPFADTDFNISQRLPSTTTAKVKWSVPPWTAQDEKFQTADISSIIQEIVNQDGWASGNALVLIFRDDKDNPSTGLREAEAVEGEATAAPLLHIEYTEAAPPVGANIIWVTGAIDHDANGVQDDQGFIDWLTAEGHTVDARLGYWAVLDANKVAELNAADLVIASRSTSSGDFDDGEEPTLWNSITKPMIVMNGNLIRSNRWKWMNTTTMVKGDDILLAVDPNHPLFEGVTLEMGNMVIFRDNTVIPGITSFVGGLDVGNGTLIARTLSAENTWIAEWAAGVEFYAGAGQIAGGRRMLFCAGTQEVAVDPQGAWDLSAEGEKVLRNAIKYILPAAP